MDFSHKCEAQDRSKLFLGSDSLLLFFYLRFSLVIRNMINIDFKILTDIDKVREKRFIDALTLKAAFFTISISTSLYILRQKWLEFFEKPCDL